MAADISQQFEAGSREGKGGEECDAAVKGIAASQLVLTRCQSVVFSKSRVPPQRSRIKISIASKFRT